MTDEEALEAFGKEFIHVVRDSALHTFEMTVTGAMKSIPMQALHQRLHSLTVAQQDDVRQIVRKFVDIVLHDVLYLLQRDEQITVLMRPPGEPERVIDLAQASDMLHAELFTESGWIARFSEYPPSREP